MVSHSISVTCKTHLSTFRRLWLPFRQLRLTQNPEWKKFWVSLEPFLLLQADLDPLFGRRCSSDVPRVTPPHLALNQPCCVLVVHPVMIFCVGRSRTDQKCLIRQLSNTKSLGLAALQVSTTALGLKERSFGFLLADLLLPSKGKSHQKCVKSNENSTWLCEKVEKLI